MNLKTLALTLVLLSPLSLAAAQGGDPILTVSMDAETYSAASTLVDGVAPLATVLLVDAEGAPIAGAAVDVTFLRVVRFVGFVTSEEVSGVTDENGVLTVAAPTNSGLPGDYFVVASASGLLGSTSYTVGA